MIEVEHLVKNFGTKTAVQDISFEVKKGEILGFLGPNAAGKTTTMRIITGFLTATSGTVRVAGHDVNKNSLAVRKHIGYLPESVPLYPDMRTKEFLEFSAALKGLTGAAISRQVGKVMEECGITHVAKELLGRLSKGYRQRVGLAQALVSDPEVLILDEPTVGLDPKQIIEIRELIKGLGGEHTIVLSTHILPEVSMTCERVIIINEGKVVASDTPANLTKQLEKSSKVLIQVKGPQKEVIKNLSQVDGVLDVLPQESSDDEAARYMVESKVDVDVRGDLAERIVKKGYTLLEMRPLEMSLEDIFIKLVTDEDEGGGKAKK